MKPPAFQFYADDFLAGTCDMTAEEVGTYILLLCHQWSRGMIPSDSARVALIARGDVSAHVLAKFPGGKNIRMEQERAKQAEYRAAQSYNGKTGADKRWRRNGDANGGAIATPMANTMAKNSSPSPSPSPGTHIVTHSLNSFPIEQEMPKGFPKTEAEAVTAGDMVGVPAAVAATAYHKAVSRGYADARGNLIQNFASYLRVEQTYASERAARDKQKPGDAGLSGADKINLGKELDRVLKEIAEIRAAGDHLDMDETTAKRMAKLKARRAELKEKLGVKV